ncbi:MAG: hypothetical protein KJ069_04850 [Anaerolineae bacterium]|nr:hypothetical protein [Anaerolineae bacterium]
MNYPPLDEGELERLQRDTFRYFVKEANPTNGLVRDNTRSDSPASITAVGLGLSAYTVAVERGWVSRAEAVARVLTTLRFFSQAPHGPEPDATGYKGFYYHFLDMDSGRRVWQSELSTIDTTFLVSGMLAAAAYFDQDTAKEREIRQLADTLYRRVEWPWALNGGLTVSHGWRPEEGFIRYRWEGYNEALLLYVLGIASPAHPLPPKSYQAWSKTYVWRELYGIEYLHGASLFMHQLSHGWIDFREIQDAFMRQKGIDYFENSRRATYVQQQYAMANPRGFRGYNGHCWGITASDGPGPATRCIDGVERHFFDYLARGIPDGPDDGTIAPWAAAASLPFAPEIVLPALRYFNEVYPEMTSKYGFKCSFNPTFTREGSAERGWVSQGYYGLDQGPIVLALENYRTGFFWKLMQGCSYLVSGLRRAGFAGGWLAG